MSNKIIMEKDYDQYLLCAINKKIILKKEIISLDFICKNIYIVKDDNIKQLVLEIDSDYDKNFENIIPIYQMSGIFNHKKRHLLKFDYNSIDIDEYKMAEIAKISNQTFPTRNTDNEYMAKRYIHTVNMYLINIFIDGVKLLIKETIDQNKLIYKDILDSNDYNL